MAQVSGTEVTNYSSVQWKVVLYIVVLWVLVPLC